MGAERVGISREMVDVFIKTSDIEATRDLIRDLGGKSHISTGEVLAASIDINAVEMISGSDEVEFIEAAKPIQLKNDMAALEVNIPEVHEGMNLPSGYAGEGVIVGLIDTGIDYTHPDFRDADGKSRIISIWNQNRSGGPAPSEIENSYGTECKAETIADGSCPLKDTDGHGTHVAGTVAGSDEVYGGVAPDANIIVVSYDSSMTLDSGYAETIFSTKICQAAYYIFRKADELGMPAVINLSLGTHIGAHDGTSLFEQCLAGLVKDSAGRAIVAAAGNEYSIEDKFTGIHAGFEVGGTSASNFVIRKLSKDNVYYIDFWGSAGSDIEVGLAIHDGDPRMLPLKFSGMVEPGKSTSGTFLDGKIEYVINYTEFPSALNGKPHAGIQMKVSPSLTNISDYSFDLVVSGSGSFDAWLFPDKPTKTINFTSIAGQTRNDWTHVPGDRIKSVAIPATSPDLIAVAGYTTRNRWSGGPACCEISFELGDLLEFSSSGPSASPELTGTKPDIAAPGAMIASAKSAQSQQNDLMILPGGSHVLQAGTSMAAPFVSGTIALMFSADPNFTYEDAKRYLVESAYVDEFVGSTPNDRWGHGKLDVLAALETAVNGGASGHFDRNSSLAETGFDESSSPMAAQSGCSLQTTTSSGGDNANTVFCGMLLLSLAALVTARRQSFVNSHTS